MKGAPHPRDPPAHGLTLAILVVILAIWLALWLLGNRSLSLAFALGLGIGAIARQIELNHFKRRTDQ